MGEKFGPIVAGKFYRDNPDDLIRQIEDCYTHEYGPGELPDVSNEELASPVGVVSPHAGYPYSGPVAAHAFRWLSEFGKPDSVVIIGTNHSGLGSAVSVLTEGSWETPLGSVEFDSDLGKELLDFSDVLEENSAPFNREHSIEVQLPFLQQLWGEDFSIVPICLKEQGQRVAEDISSALLQSAPGGTLLLASTDFTHYESQEIAEKKDGRAIDAIIDLDVEEFYRTVSENSISICGAGSIGTLMDFAISKGLQPAKLQYATSGEVSGYGREVVGYGAIGFR